MRWVTLAERDLLLELLESKLNDFAVCERYSQRVTTD